MNNDRLTDRHLVLVPEPHNTIGDSPFICIGRPCVQDGHLTAKFAVVPRILSRSAMVAHFFVRHLGCDYLVSSNSVDISKSRVRGPMPLIEIDTNIATSTLPRNGEISLDAVRVEVGLLDVALPTPHGRTESVKPRLAPPTSHGQIVGRASRVLTYQYPSNSSADRAYVPTGYSA